VIEASLSFFKGREKKLILAVFFIFAAFPSDSIIPLSVFDSISVSLVQCSMSLADDAGFLFKPTLSFHLASSSEVNRAVVSVRRTLNDLLKHNLICGTMSEGAGLSMQNVI